MVHVRTWPVEGLTEPSMCTIGVLFSNGIDGHGIVHFPRSNARSHTHTALGSVFLTLLVLLCFTLSSGTHRHGHTQTTAHRALVENPPNHKTSTHKRPVTETKLPQQSATHKKATVPAHRQANNHGQALLYSRGSSDDCRHGRVRLWYP